jgi:hypothetical protein
LTVVGSSITKNVGEEHFDGDPFKYPFRSRKRFKEKFVRVAGGISKDVRRNLIARVGNHIYRLPKIMLSRKLLRGGDFERGP